MIKQTGKRCVALLLVFALTLGLSACGGKQDDSLHARFAVLYESKELQKMHDNPEEHADEIAAFALQDFASTFADVSAFRSYTVEIHVRNANDFAIEILNLQMSTLKQGKNGVYFAASTNAPQIGLPANFTGDEALYYTVIADAKLSMQQILRTLGEMKISCVYARSTDVPDGIDAEIDPSKLMTCAILYEA